MVTTENDIIAEEMSRAMLREASQCGSDAYPEHAQDVSILQRRNSTIEKLPPELLLLIFQFVAPPHHQHDPSIVPGPQSAWMSALRTRKALVMTCKSFFGPATEVLYEDIVLRRMGQIPALARTLDPSRTPAADAMAALVRGIRMDSCVVWTPFADVVREELHLILRRCTALRSFSFHPHANFSFYEDPEGDAFDAFNPKWLFTLNPNGSATDGLLHPFLAHGLSALDLVLDLGEEVDFLAFHSLLASAASRLTKLKLKLTDLCAVEPPSLGPTRQLSSIEDLSYHASEAADWFIPYMCHAWCLPQLQALTVIEPGDHPVNTLLRTHGARLTYLHWRNEHLDYEQSYALDGLASSCPRLEHLVIQRYTSVLPVIRSPSLRFLDFWAAYEAPPPQEVLLGVMSPGSATPRLERTRVLAGPPLHFEFYPPTLDWPRLCPPLAVNGARYALWRFPAMRVIQTAWGVFFEDALYFYSQDLLNVVAPGPDMEPGESYEPGDDEEEDATSALSSDGSFDADVGESSVELEEDAAELLRGGPAVGGGPIERELLLAMFGENQLDPPLLLEDIHEH